MPPANSSPRSITTTTSVRVCADPSDSLRCAGRSSWLDRFPAESSRHWHRAWLENTGRTCRRICLAGQWRIELARERASRMPFHRSAFALSLRRDEQRAGSRRSQSSAHETRLRFHAARSSAPSIVERVASSNFEAPVRAARWFHRSIRCSSAGPPSNGPSVRSTRLKSRLNENLVSAPWSRFVAPDAEGSA